MRIWNQIIAKLLPFFQKSGQESGPVSLVLLLKRPSFWSGHELATSIARAFDVPFSAENPEQVIKSMNNKAVLYIKPHLVSIFAASRPYLSQDPREFAKSFSGFHLQEAWANHNGWAAIDYIRGRDDVPAQYGVLSKIAVELANENCSGVFLPREGLLFANDETLPERLGRIS